MIRDTQPVIYVGFAEDQQSPTQNWSAVNLQIFDIFNQSTNPSAVVPTESIKLQANDQSGAKSLWSVQGAPQLLYTPSLSLHSSRQIG